MELEREGIIPPRTVCHWRSAEGHHVPAPDGDERVILVSHLLRGLSLPPSEFFVSVLDYYGLQPHNLGPSSILYLAGFQALFEGYLGIAPSLEFFKYCFHCKRQTEDKELLVVGTVSLNLRKDRSWYPKAPKIDSVKGWTGTFFYCKDVAPADKTIGIPAFTNSAAQSRSSWDEKPLKVLPTDLRLIQRRIEFLTKHAVPKLTGTDTII